MGLDPLTLSIGASVVGGVLQSRATKDAANTQAAAADRATQLQREQYDAATQRNAPFVTGGTQAFNSLLDRLGLSGNVSAPGYNTFGKAPTAEEVMAEPGYQFGQQQGQQAIDRQLNARGMTNSGAQIKAAARFGTDYASGQYGNAFARTMQGQQQAYNQLSGTASMGQASANNTAAAGQQFASAAGNNIIGAGNAQAANTIGQGSIWGNALNQGVSAYGRMSGGGSGSGFGSVGGGYIDPSGIQYNNPSAYIHGG